MSGINRRLTVIKSLKAELFYFDSGVPPTSRFATHTEWVLLGDWLQRRASCVIRTLQIEMPTTSLSLSDSAPQFETVRIGHVWMEHALQKLPALFENRNPFSWGSALYTDPQLVGG